MRDPQKKAERPRKVPPHVAIGDLRRATGLTLDELCERMTEITGHSYTRGAISAIEIGIRGASVDTLQAIALAYGLAPNALRTNYQPANRELIA